MKKAIPFLVAVFTLSACGKIDLTSPKKTVTNDQFALTGYSQPLSAQDFSSACATQGGVLISNSTICVYQSAYKQLGNGGYVTSDATADYDVADIASGTAVQATGTVSGGSVELMLNNSPIASIPTSKPVTTNGGHLAFRLHPGSFYGVKVYVYTCLNQAMKPTRCPY
jgi:hypothetical protein